jgi:hypothetical protein
MSTSLAIAPMPEPREAGKAPGRRLTAPCGPSAWDFVWSRMVEWTEEVDGLLAGLMRSPDARTVARAKRDAEHGLRLVQALRQLAVDGADPAALEEVERIVVPHIRELDAVLLVVEPDVSEAPAAGEPITTWKAAARVLGISEDTLSQRRRAAGDRSRPWWSNADATRAWFEALKEARPSAKAPGCAKASATGSAVNWDSVKL